MASDQTKKMVRVEMAEETHPDGGWGWVVCGAAFFQQFVILGMQNSAGIVFSALVNAFPDDDRGVISWVTSLAVGMMFFMGPLSTSLCERYGPRIVTLIGCIMTVAGLMASAFSSNIYVLYLTYGLLWGIGSSLCYFPTLVILVKYFQRYLALANGIVTAGSGLGALAMGPAMEKLFSNIGTKFTFQILAGIHSAILICAFLYRPVAEKYRLRQERAHGGGKLGKKQFFDWSIFRNKGYLMFTFCLAIFMLGYFVPFIHLIRHAIDIGVEPEKASFLVGYLALASAIGRVLFGKLADLPWVNRLYVDQLGLLFMSVATSLVPAANTYPLLVCLALLFGLFEGCYVVLIPVLCTDLVGPQKMAYALGALFCIMSGPMTLGPPIAGWIYEASGSYATAFFSAGATITLGAVMMFLVPLVSTKPSTIVHEYAVEEEEGEEKVVSPLEMYRDNHEMASQASVLEAYFNPTRTTMTRSLDGNLYQIVEKLTTI